MDHGDGCDHFHHPCCRYIHRLPKVSKVGIYCGYYLYHDLVTIQEWLHIKAGYKLFTLKFNTFAFQSPLLGVCKMPIIIYFCMLFRVI